MKVVDAVSAKLEESNQHKFSRSIYIRTDSLCRKCSHLVRHHNCLCSDLQHAPQTNRILMNAQEEDYEIECNLNLSFRRQWNLHVQMAINHALSGWLAWRIYDSLSGSDKEAVVARTRIGIRFKIIAFGVN